MPHAGSAAFLYAIERSQARLFDDVGLWRNDAVAVTGRAEPEEVAAVDVSDGVLPMLGARPLLGRLFSREDDSPASAETVVVTGGYWRTRLGANPAIVGQTLVVDGRAREIIGVLDERFTFLDRRPALVLPLRIDSREIFLGGFAFHSIARLKSGATLAQASADVARLIPLALHEYPTYPGSTVRMFEEARIAPALRPLRDSLVGGVGGVLWTLLGMIGLLLLVACANVANLLLVRAEGRHQELAIRSALGAGTTRLARDLLLESVTLGVAGGAAGLVVAAASLRLLVAIAPASLPRAGEIGIDAAVLAFTLAIAAGAGLLFGLMPVFKYVGPGLAESLQSGGRAATGSAAHRRTRNTLVVVQIALAAILLVGSGLLMRTLDALRHVDPGFSRPGEVQTLRLSIPESQIAEPERVARMQQAILDAIGAVPGVKAAALSSEVPMAGGGLRGGILVENRPQSAPLMQNLRRWRFVGPGTFAALGTPIVAGRDLSWVDIYDRRPVVLVSASLARELWRAPAAAIGQRLRDSADSPWREVVGVVADVREDGVDQEAPPTVYWPFLMSRFSGDETTVRRTVAFVVRSGRTGSSGFVDEIGRAVWSVNPNLPLSGVRTLQDIYEQSMSRTSFTFVMLLTAAVMALLVGFSGVYGVIAYAVAQRRRELGIRIALGARRAQVTWLFVGDGLRLGAIGVVAGLAVAAPLTRVLGSLLFQVSAIDPVTYVAVGVSVAAAAVVASLVPARSAARVDPARVLHAD
jgi:predicted permease